MNPVGHNGAPTFTRPRAPSLLNPVTPGSSSAGAATAAEQAKLSSEGSYSGSVSPSAVSVPRDNNSDYENFSDEDLRDDEETGLTSKEKKKREKKRRRNTRLDQRIAREKNLSADEKRELDKGIAKRIAINLVLVLMWYLLSLAISLVRGFAFPPLPPIARVSSLLTVSSKQYNKWMFDKDRLNFAFPLFTTSMHMVVQFALSALVLYFVPSLRPPGAHNSDSGRSRHETESANHPVMDKWFYLTRIGPCGAATGLDIGLGNTSLKFISLTFYSMSSIYS